MNSRIVRPEVVWAVLGMEAGRGHAADRVDRARAMAPRAWRGRWCCCCCCRSATSPFGAFERLRDPAWRILAGFVLVVALRFQAPLAGGDGAAAAMARFLQAIVPAALAFALWWRGGSFVEAELTAADVHLEFVAGWRDPAHRAGDLPRHRARSTR